MNRKKELYIVLTLFVISVFIIWLAILNKKLNKDKTTIIRYAHLLKTEKEQLKSRYLASVMINDYKLNDNLYVLNTKGKVINLDSLVSRNPKLIFRYTKLSCNMCVTKQIQILNSFVDSIGINNVFILAGVDKTRYAAAFKRVNKIKCEVLLFNNFEFDKIVNSNEAPYYFIISKDKTIKNIFIPIIDIPDLTKNYLYLISKQYFLINK